MKTGNDRNRNTAEKFADLSAKNRDPEEFVGLEDSGELPEWAPGVVSDTKAPKFTLLSEGEIRTFAVVFEEGAEVIQSLRHFADERQLLASHFTAIGAFSSVVLGFFDPIERRYIETSVREQVEVLSLIGDITLEGGVHQVHAHVVIGKSDGTAHGGHLIRGHVFPTLELILVETSKSLERRFDPATGLALIKPDMTPGGTHSSR